MGQIERAKERLQLAPDCPAVCCCESCRGGFWLHRYREAHGIENLVVDGPSP